jgi:4-hydroxy-3-polyprenylbenzoate decarboxylase
MNITVNLASGAGLGEPPIVVGITGASGAAYAVRLLRVLSGAGRSIRLSISPSAVEVIRAELGISIELDRFDPRHLIGESADLGSIVYHRHDDFSASIASGSFLTAGMVIVPCSMSTLASIAHGITTNLITRGADVHLKERRKLIVVPRETPLSLVHLENMTTLTRAGGVVLPAAPGWYHRPRSTGDLVDFVVARICDQLGIAHELSRRWGVDADDSASAH